MDTEYLNLAQSTIELSTRLKSLWKAATKEEKRDPLEMLVSNPVLDKQTLRFESKKPHRLLGEMKKEKVCLPEPSIFRTWNYDKVFKGYAKPRSLRPRKIQKKRAFASKEARAARLQSILEGNRGMTRADLARQLGCSRAWVTKVLREAT